jgi:pre-mRNA-processing factor 40
MAAITTPVASNSSTNKAGSGGSVYTVQQIDLAWKEYTAPNGVKYYHNAILKESTYIKPDAMTKLEAPVTAATSTSAPAATTTPSSSSQQRRPWQEYEDANTGKKYYSDGITTTWEKPEGFISPDAIVASTLVQEERNEPSKKKRKSSGGEGKTTATSFGGREEAVAAFKGMLLAKGISPTLKWNEVIKLCETDSRWEACKVLSVGERRQALAEYQTKRASEIRDEQRLERARAKEAFGQLLTDILPTISGFSARTSKFADVRNALAKDDRFHAVEEEATRESLFLDFCDDFRKREERKKRSRKREVQESFINFLQEKEESGSLTFASTWESFLLSLSEEEKGDSRFATSTILPDSERQLYFADFVIELQKAEDDKRRRIRDARRRAEKAQRDKYREFLRTQAATGTIFPYSRWRGVEELLSGDESFILVQAQNRDAPRELFEEFVDEWDDMYRRERSFLARCLESSVNPAASVTTETTFEEFKSLLKNRSSYSTEVQNETFRIINRDDPVSSARLFYNELIARAADAERYGAKRGPVKDDSSEDEGEIIEEGEVTDNKDKKVPLEEPQKDPDSPEAGETEPLDQTTEGEASEDQKVVDS